ncbi:MAG: endolytic transglycosylase MltG [Magnetococcales bacterium]|nr:endolytic transglycosylase MltG [Magnetococcales bacterium]
MKRRIFKIAAAILMGLLLLAGGAGLVYVRFLDSALTEPRRVMIEKGWGVPQIARHLESRSAIPSAFWFVWLVRLDGPDGARLHAGEYQFEIGETPPVLLNRMKRGDVVRHRFTFPEGLNLREIAARLRSQGWEEADQRLADPGLPAKLGVQAPSLEGWLFPETYQFVRGDSLEELLTRMTRMTRKILDREWAQRAPEVNLTPLESLILASIIEKETGQAQERTRISAVFHNRLRRQMRLESDPTVIYGLPDFNGDITHRDLTNPTPFNTYVIRGLPPTPICNPGAASIHAALHPDQTEELYFVASGDGFHQFSKSYAEHRAKVNRYQRGNREGAGRRENDGRP